MAEPATILNDAFQRAITTLEVPVIANIEIREKVDYVARNLGNRAGVRLLMACLLAKIHNPAIDVRKPYTQIGEGDSFSGRTYDEQYLTAFINQHNLPCNNTTAFLTPALRNRNTTLEKGINLVGRPPQLYDAVLDLLDHIHQNRVSASDLLVETIRDLILLRNERQARIEALLEGLKTTRDSLPLSSEQIVLLIEQHLSLKGTSRLPVLLVAAAYQVAEPYIGERILALQAHNAADVQTGAIGDVEITLISENKIATCYEMKDKTVTREDIDRALQKLYTKELQIDNYIFITTEKIDEVVQDYARSQYEATGGIEVVILDCIAFIKHYLHLFHRLRTSFLNEYQSLILAEPESSITQPVKEAFLSMRQVAEAD